jgi:transcriptional regulator with XRE-family HTH domain
MLVFDGKEFRRLRKQAGIRPEAMAVALGRSAATVRFYEQGRAEPTIAMVGKIAAQLGCDPLALLQTVPAPRVGERRAS